MQNQLQLFIQNNDKLDIPVDILTRFIENFDKRDQWLNSGIIYDNWMYIYYSKYQNFVADLQKELVENEHFHLQNLYLKKVEDSKIEVVQNNPFLEKNEFSSADLQIGQNKYKSRVIYLVSYKSICQLEMLKNKKARMYYIQLEDLLQKFMTNNYNLMIQQFKAQKDEFDQLMVKFEETKKIGYIYMIRNKNDYSQCYIGQTTQSLKSRFSNHKSQARQYLKTDFLKYIFDLGCQQMEIIFIEEVHFHLKQELNDREKFHINDKQSPLNMNLKQ